MQLTELKIEIEQLIKQVGKEFNAHKDTASLFTVMEKLQELYKKLAVYEHLMKHIEDQKPKQGELDLFSAPEKEEVSISVQQESQPEQEVPAQEQPFLQVGISIEDIPKPQYPDIRTMIGINEKFLFINELFAGNQQEYGIAINQINTINTETWAKIYLDSLKALYHWDETNPTYESFTALISRRFQQKMSS